MPDGPVVPVGHPPDVRPPEAERVSETLRDRGVVVDFRPSNLIRACPAPLYTRFVDVWEFVTHLREILETGGYEDPDTENSVT